MAVEGNGDIVGITQAFMAAAGHHHIHTAEQGGQGFVALDQAIQLIHHHDLVHAGGDQGVDGSLHIGGHLLQIAGGRIGVILDGRAVRR